MNLLRGVMSRYPRITAHVIAESLGYATPTTAASIVAAAKERRPHYCEWIDACYGNDALRAVQDAIRSRHYHTGYMAEYRLARALVDRAVETGKEPELGSWF